MITDDVVPVDPKDPNFNFHNTRWLKELFNTATRLKLTIREGAPKHGDKVGNLDAVWVVFTSNGTANTEDATMHTLGRTPKWIWPMIPDKAARLYDSTTAHTKTTLYTKTSVATVAWKVIIG